MKKFLLFTIIVILIPVIIVFTVDKKEEPTPKFNVQKNQMVRVKDEKTGNIQTVNLEEYVLGVISGEMPASFSKEALKAQAVASRSYVLNKIASSVNNEYDVVDTISNQVYLSDDRLQAVWKDDYSKNLKKMQEVIKETEGEYLVYDGKIANTLFFSTSPGFTENCEEVFVAALPYLRSVESVWDKKAPNFEVTKEFEIEEFKKLLELNNIDQIEIIKKTSTGRVDKLKIDNKEIEASDMRTKLKLRSTYMDIKIEKDKIIVTTKGNGHGVGMSQYGALGMSDEGYKYDEILKHYYTGTELKKSV